MRTRQYTKNRPHKKSWCWLYARHVSCMVHGPIWGDYYIYILLWLRSKVVFDIQSEKRCLRPINAFCYYSFSGTMPCWFKSSAVTVALPSRPSPPIIMFVSPQSMTNGHYLYHIKNNGKFAQNVKSKVTLCTF